MLSGTNCFANSTTMMFHILSIYHHLESMRSHSIIILAEFFSVLNLRWISTGGVMCIYLSSVFKYYTNFMYLFLSQEKSFVQFNSSSLLYICLTTLSYPFSETIYCWDWVCCVFVITWKILVENSSKPLRIKWFSHQANIGEIYNFSSLFVPVCATHEGHSFLCVLHLYFLNLIYVICDLSVSCLHISNTNASCVLLFVATGPRMEFKSGAFPDLHDILDGIQGKNSGTWPITVHAGPWMRCSDSEHCKHVPQTVMHVVNSEVNSTYCHFMVNILKII